MKSHFLQLVSGGQSLDLIGGIFQGWSFTGGPTHFDASCSITYELMLKPFPQLGTYRKHS